MDEYNIETLVYAARLKDRDRLNRSSSGGGFGALSDVFLDKGNAVISAVYNYDSKQTEFILYTDKSIRDAAIGSKYMQSIPGEVFTESRDWLKDNPEKELLFVGMGCQSAGFLKYAEVSGFRNRVTVVDIICHGSPSPMLWREYAERKENGGKIEYITFKDKRNGWKHPTAVACIKGKEISLSDYVKIFYNRCELRPACHKCPYACVIRNVDITIGDFWGIEDVMPDFYDDLGTSLFLIHTEKGKYLFEQVRSMLEYRESNIKDCLQPNLERPTPESEDRSVFWQDYMEHGIGYIMKKYGNESGKSKIKKMIKKLMGGGIAT